VTFDSDVSQILLVFVIVLSLSNAAVTVALQHVIPFTSIGETVAFLPAPFLTRLNHLRTRRSSSILLLFWPVYLLLCAVWTRTVISAEFSDVDKVTLALRWSLLLTGLVSFILEYAGSESWSELAEEQGQPENPVVITNIFQM
jgi:ATP-binding cassette subfamily C (CFTR/MRP) protein 1